MTTYSIYDLPETVKVHHARRTKAENLQATFASEYPTLSLDCDLNEDESQIVAFVVVVTDDEGEKHVIIEDQRAPDLADVLDAAIEAGFDPEAGYEEPKATGSVVDPHYRATYRTASTSGQSCGDWLAEWLDVETKADGKTVFEDLEALFSANGLDLTAKWAMNRSNGWVGRYRMNGRQVLEKRIAKLGTVADAMGNEHEVPAEFLADLRTKHGKWLAKIAKAALAKAQAEDDAAAA